MVELDKWRVEFPILSLRDYVPHERYLELEAADVQFKILSGSPTRHIDIKTLREQLKVDITEISSKQPLLTGRTVFALALIRVAYQTSRSRSSVTSVAVTSKDQPSSTVQDTNRAPR